MRNGLLIATTLATLAFAGPASAATVKVEDGDLVYTAAAGEFNELNIMLQGGRFTLQDGTTGFASTLPVTVEAPCEPQNSGYAGDMMDAYCPPDGVERILVDVGDGADSVGIGAMTDTPYPTVIALGDGGDRLWGGKMADEVSGGEGDDTLTPNAGRDTVDAGAGDDTIAAVDGFPDEIACGEGYDVVDADDVDLVDGCENIRTGAPGPLPVEPPPAPPQPPALPEPPVAEPVVAPPAPRVLDVITPWPTRRRLARLGLFARVLCPEGCYLSSQLRLRTRHGWRVVGEGRARHDDPGIASVRTRMLPRAMRRLRALRRPRLVLRFEATSGVVTTVLSRRIWLSASR